MDSFQIRLRVIHRRVQEILFNTIFEHLRTAFESIDLPSIDDSFQKLFDGMYVVIF